MSNSRTRSLLGLAAVYMAIAACSFLAPGNSQPPGSEATLQAVIGTSVAATLTAHPSPTATAQPTATPTLQPSPTACQAMVTASVNANVRNGPGTSYDVIGSLRQGQSAHVVATDETATWWYIELGSGHGWIAARVSTVVCIPNDLTVITY